jgi:hypothetical protein
VYVLRKYPKLLLFIVSVIIVYFFFSRLLYEPLHDALVYLGYFGTFLAGLLYPYAFTSAAGTAILIIISKEQNILLAGMVASAGALISDIIIFFFVKYTFAEEMRGLSKEAIVMTLSRRIPNSFRIYLLASIAAILIASPLPTEMGIMLMASIKKITTKKFVAIIYILHEGAIFVILLISKI